MYKHQKPLTVSSALLASLVTVLVLLAASTAKAQDTEELPLRENLEAPRSVVPAAVKTNEQNTLNQTQKPAEASMRTRMNSSTSTKEIEGTKSSATERLTDVKERREAWQKSQVERQKRIEEKRMALASSTIGRKAALQEQAQERISQRTEKLIGFLNRAIDKLRGFSQRLQEKSNSLSDNGADTQQVNTLLDGVEETLMNAEEALKGIDVSVEYALTSDQPRDAWLEVKDQILATREQIRGAHALLREAMAELKVTIAQQREEKDNGDSE